MGRRSHEHLLAEVQEGILLALLKPRGALRAHDTEGVPPATLTWEVGVGLQGEIMRSKTTGAGRRVEVVQFHISVNYALFVTMNKDAKSESRDFLMARPSENLHGFAGAMLSRPHVELDDKECSPLLNAQSHPSISFFDIGVSQMGEVSGAM